MPTLEELAKTLVVHVLQSAPHDQIASTFTDVASKLMSIDTPEPATWHPTGFLVVPLIARNDENLTRIHIWPAQPRLRPTPDWPIHNHIWKIASHIICGSLTDNMFDVQPSPSGEHQFYVPACTSAGNVLQASGERIRYTPKRSKTYQQGDHYVIPQEAYHMTTVSKGLAATIVVMVEPSFGTTRVVGDLVAEPWYRSEREQCDSVTVRHLLREVTAIATKTH